LKWQKALCLRTSHVGNTVRVVICQLLQCTWKTTCFFVCISASVENIFMKIHVCCFPRMRYTHCTFCSRRSITNGTLLSEHYNWSTVSRLPLEGFSWNTIPRTLLACATNIVSLVVIGRKLQFVASFLPVGRAGVGGRAYWSLWNGERWVLISLKLQFDKAYCTYGSGEQTLDQIWSCISDSLLAYRLKVPPAKTVHVTLNPWSRALPENLT